MAAYWKIAVNSAYNIFAQYKYLIVNLVFSHFGFWSGNFFLIAPLPDHCLLVPFYAKILKDINFCSTKISIITVKNLCILHGQVFVMEYEKQWENVSRL